MVLEVCRQSLDNNYRFNRYLLPQPARSISASIFLYSINLFFFFYLSLPLFPYTYKGGMIYFHKPMAHVHITPKQLEILLLLYRFRFLNRHQLQHFLNHKDPKRLNTWLKHLTTHNIIGRHYSTRLKENTKPAIYFLTTAKQIQTNITEPTVKNLLKRVYRENTALRLQEHCLFLADFYLLLEKYATTQQATSPLLFPATDLVDPITTCPSVNQMPTLPWLTPLPLVATLSWALILVHLVLCFAPNYSLSWILEYTYLAKQTGHPNPSILHHLPWWHSPDIYEPIRRASTRRRAERSAALHGPERWHTRSWSSAWYLALNR